MSKKTVKELAKSVFDKAYEMIEGSDLSKIEIHLGETEATTFVPTPKGIVVIQATSVDDDYGFAKEVTLTPELFEALVKVKNAAPATKDVIEATG